MEIFFTVLIMVLIVVFSGLLSKILPFQIPIPLIQIVTGFILTSCNICKLHINFDPDWFFVILIPPLLFADGWKLTTSSDLLYHKREVICLAFILVLFTVIVSGFFIYFNIPGISIIPSFALAAVLAPTDAVALTGIIGDSIIPKRIMTILQGEALMNDAAGLMALKFTLYMFNHVVIQWHDAISDIFKFGLGGLGTGIIICWIYSRFIKLLSIYTDEPTVQIILLLLLPFASYLIADYIGVSGILSCVASGMTVTYSGLIRKSPLAMRLRINSVWHMVEFVLNGIIFVLLGWQLPLIVKMPLVQSTHNFQIWILFSDIIIIYLILIFLRFIWLCFMKAISKIIFKSNPLAFSKYSTNELLIISFAGVRGVITLAGVLSIPIFIDNYPLYVRCELIFIATGIIILSLLVGTILLPILLPNIEVIDKCHQLTELKFAHSLIAEVAIASVQKMVVRLAKNREENIDNELLQEISMGVISDLRSRINNTNNPKYNLFTKDLERRFRLTALRAERGEIYHLRATKQVSHETMEKILRELDLLEALLIETD